MKISKCSSPRTKQYVFFKAYEEIKYFKYQIFYDLNYICGLAHFQKRNNLQIKDNIIKLRKKSIDNKKKEINNIKIEKISILKNLFKEDFIEEELFKELVKKMNLSNRKYGKNFLSDCSLYIKYKVKKFFKKKNKCSVKNFKKYEKKIKDL